MKVSERQHPSKYKKNEERLRFYDYIKLLNPKVSARQHPTKYNKNKNKKN